MRTAGSTLHRDNVLHHCCTDRAAPERIARCPGSTTSPTTPCLAISARRTSICSSPSSGKPRAATATTSSTTTLSCRWSKPAPPRPCSMRSRSRRTALRGRYPLGAAYAPVRRVIGLALPHFVDDGLYLLIQYRARASRARRVAQAGEPVGFITPTPLRYRLNAGLQVRGNARPRLTVGTRQHDADAQFFICRGFANRQASTQFSAFAIGQFKSCHKPAASRHRCSLHQHSNGQTTR